MENEIKRLIFDAINQLNYDNSDEELYKYLCEKGFKAITKFQNNHYSIDEMRRLLLDNIPHMMTEYQRLKQAMDKKTEEITMLGSSLNYQLIELFEIANQVANEDQYEKLKKQFLSSQPIIFPGIEECNYEQACIIFKNIICNCDVITPEAEAKMSLTVRSDLPLFDENGFINPEIFDFSYLDKVVTFAQKYNMKIRLHTLVWHKHFPTLLKDCSKEQVFQFLNKYFSIIVDRYGEKLFSTIDVLNEICVDVHSDEFLQGDVLRNSPWKDKLGDDYYLEILKLARKHFPTSKLAYNEYDETNQEKRNRMIQIIEKIKTEEQLCGTTLLDSIGLQSHYHEFTSDEDIKQAYHDLSEVNKELQVSELDIIKIDENSDIQTNRVVRTVLDCACSYGVNNFTCWGPTSIISWKSGKVRTLLDDYGNFDSSFEKLVRVYSQKSKQLVSSNSQIDGLLFEQDNVTKK